MTCFIFFLSFLSACSQLPARVVHHDIYSGGKKATWSSLKSSPPPATKKAAAKPGYRTITVRAGDTVRKLAKRHKVAGSEIIRANGLKAPYPVRPGQKLKIPSMSIPAQTAKAKSAPEKKSIKQAAAPAVEEPVAAIASPPPLETGVFRAGRGSGKFGWPVRGPVIAGFGKQKSGVFNDGINIRAREGEKIFAADDGEVVFTGKELKGYGNILIIKHKNGYITAYAHNREVLVRRGQRVRRGQAVALAGATGSVDSPQLHFAVRKGKKALDPMAYLAG